MPSPAHRFAAGAALLALVLASCSSDGDDASGPADPEPDAPVVDLVLERSTSDSLSVAEAGGALAGVVAAGPESPWLIVGNDVDEHQVTTPSVYVSADGTTWERGEIEPGEGDALSVADVARNGETTVAVGSNRSGAGQQAAAWVSDGSGSFARVDQVTADPGTASSAYLVEPGPQGFVAIGTSGTGDEQATTFSSSDDGRRWASMDDVAEVVADSGKPTVTGIAFLDRTMVVVGTVERAGDQDAAAWVAAPDERPRRIEAEAFAGPGEQQIRDLTVHDGVLHAAGHVERDGRRHSSVWRSSDGHDWQLVPTSFDVLDRHVNTYGSSLTSIRPNGTGLVAIDDGSANTRLVRSDDGVAWSEVQLPDNLHRSTNYDLGEIAVGAADDFVAISPDGDTPLVLRVTPDGIVETTATDSVFPAPRPVFHLDGVTAAGDRLVAWGGRDTRTRRVGGAGADAVLWESADGREWARVEQGGTLDRSEMSDVTAFRDGMAAVGREPYIESLASVRDSNPIFWLAEQGDWRKLPGAEVVPVDEEHTYTATAVIETPGGLVAAGSEFDDERVRGLVWTSADGLGWREVPAEQGLVGSGNQSVGDLCSFDGGLVIVGSERTGSQRSAAAWISTDDGTAWERSGDLVSPDGADDNVWSCASTTDGVVVAGQRSRADGATEPALWRTDDGRTWVDVTPDELAGAGRHVNSIVADGDVVVAVGVDDEVRSGDPAVWTSADGGRTWRQRQLDLAAIRGTQGQYLGDAHLADGRLTVAGGVDSQPAIWSGELD